MAINIKAVVAAFNQAGIPVTADFHALSMRQVAVVLEQAQLSEYRKPAEEKLPTMMCFFRHVQRLASSLPEKVAAQAEAIAEADAHLNNAGLPTYSEMKKALSDLFDVFEYYKEPEKVAAAKAAYAVLINADGFQEAARRAAA